MKKFVDLVKSVVYSIFTCGSTRPSRVEAVANTVRTMTVPTESEPVGIKDVSVEVTTPVKSVKNVKKPKSVKVETEVVVPKDPQEIKVRSAIEQIKSEGGKLNITNIAKHAKVSTTIAKKYFK